MSYKQSADGVFELISFYSYMIDLKDNETCRLDIFHFSSGIFQKIYDGYIEKNWNSCEANKEIDTVILK